MFQNHKRGKHYIFIKNFNALDTWVISPVYLTFYLFINDVRLKRLTHLKHNNLLTSVSFHLYNMIQHSQDPLVGETGGMRKQRINTPSPQDKATLHFNPKPQDIRYVNHLFLYIKCFTHPYARNLTTHT